MNEPWRNPDGSVNYHEYINSQEWRRRRRAYLRKYPLCNRCAMDNEVHRERFRTYLHVHHVSYARLGAELDEDLEALCKRCHNAEETAEFDPTEYGDPLAIDLGVGIERGRPVLTGIEFGVINFGSPAEVFWTRALEQIDTAKRAIANRNHTETAWNQLQRLDWLEQFARKCLELACPEYVLNPVEAEEAVWRVELEPDSE